MTKYISTALNNYLDSINIMAEELAITNECDIYKLELFVEKVLELLYMGTSRKTQLKYLNILINLLNPIVSTIKINEVIVYDGYALTEYDIYDVLCNKQWKLLNDYVYYERARHFKVNIHLQ